VCDNCYLVTTAGLYGFKNATNRHKSKIIHTVKEYAVHTAKAHTAVLKQDFRERLFFRGIEVILTVRDLRLSQRRRRFKSSGMLRRVDWHIVTDLPNDSCVCETSVTTYQSTQTTSDFHHNKFTLWFHCKETSKT